MPPGGPQQHSGASSYQQPGPGPAPPPPAPAPAAVYSAELSLGDSCSLRVRFSGYHTNLLVACQAQPGARQDAEKNSWLFPLYERDKVLAALRRVPGGRRAAAAACSPVCAGAEPGTGKAPARRA
jgi:hypothetical protein